MLILISSKSYIPSLLIHFSHWICHQIHTLGEENFLRGGVPQKLWVYLKITGMWVLSRWKKHIIFAIQDLGASFLSKEMYFSLKKLSFIHQTDMVRVSAQKPVLHSPTNPSRKHMTEERPLDKEDLKLDQLHHSTSCLSVSSICLCWWITVPSQGT